MTRMEEGNKQGGTLAEHKWLNIWEMSEVNVQDGFTGYLIKNITEVSQ